jgi:uncharacterized protein YidB (DUF937 family)
MGGTDFLIAAHAMAKHCAAITKTPQKVPACSKLCSGGVGEQVGSWLVAPGRSCTISGLDIATSSSER